MWTSLVSSVIVSFQLIFSAKKSMDMPLNIFRFESFFESSFNLSHGSKLEITKYCKVVRETKCYENCFIICLFAHSPFCLLVWLSKTVMPADTKFDDKAGAMNPPYAVNDIFLRSV